MNAFVRAGALLFALVLSACYPTTVTPIGSSGPMTPDARLVGMWKGMPKDPKDGPNYITFLPRKDSLEAIIVTPAHGDDHGGWMTFAAHTGKVGKNSFINARELLDDGQPPSDDTAKDYTPVLYVFGKDGTLRMYMLDDKPVEDAIDKGLLKGEYKKSDFGDDIRITASAKELDDFFISHDPKNYFTELLGTYRRVKN